MKNWDINQERNMIKNKHLLAAIIAVSVVMTACGQSAATTEVTEEVTVASTEASSEEESTVASEALVSTEVSENEAAEEESGFTVTVSDDQIMYATEIADIRDLPNEEGEEVGQLEQNEEVTVTGYVESYNGEPCLWYQIGDNQFVNAAYLNDKPVAVQQTAAKKKSTTSSTKKNTQQQTDAAAQAAAAQKAAQAAAAQQAAQQAAAQQEYYYDDVDLIDDGVDHYVEIGWGSDGGESVE